MRRANAEARSGGTKRWVLVWISAALLALAGVAAGCGGDDDDSAGTEQGGPPPGATGATGVAGGQEVTVTEILADPEAFDGRRVVVSGSIGQSLVDPGAFTIGAEVEGDGLEAEQILVVPLVGTQVPDDLAEGDAVQVTGTVDIVAADIEQEDEFLFEETEDIEFIDDFVDQPAIVATGVDATVPEENGGEQEQQ